MSQDDPLMILLVAGLTGYLFSLWLDDWRRAQSGSPDPRAFPGATTCPVRAAWVAVIGALVLLALETGGEYGLGISSEQKDITVLFLLPMVAAAFGEELIFRGFLVVTSRGRAALIGSIIGFSILFALGHEFLWNWKSLAPGESYWSIFDFHRFSFDFSLKAWWSTAMVFVFSLWQYAMRFPLRYPKLNPHHSLIPCIAAHLAKNLGVFAIKLLQGHVHKWW